MLQNIQCLVSQKQKTKTDFAECAQEESVDIFALTETWLRDAIDNKEINIPGYNIFSCDRACEIIPNFPHGGCILLHKGQSCGGQCQQVLKWEMWGFGPHNPQVVFKSCVQCADHPKPIQINSSIGSNGGF